MPAGQAFALGGLLVDWCAAASAALLWLLPGLVAFSGALGGLQGFFGSALLQWGGAHVGLQKSKSPHGGGLCLWLWVESSQG